MKIGDLVKWDGKGDWCPDLKAARADAGIIVDGPRREDHEPAISYAVAWFDAKTTFWHNDYNLELLSEAR